MKLEANSTARLHSLAVSLSSGRTGKKICMVVYSDYTCDNRVRRYAEALVKRGDQVDVVTLASGDRPPRVAELNGVTTYQIQHRQRNEHQKLTYAWRWLHFFVSSLIFLTRRHRQVKYDVIHVHNMPDFLVFAAWYPKKTGAKVILDIHDIMPELFRSKFNVKEGSLQVKLLKFIEKKSSAFADHIIISNHLWQEKLITRSVSRDKCSALVNHVDRGIFYWRKRTRTDGKFVIIYAGTFQWHQGLNIAIDAFSRIADREPQVELHLYGQGDAKQSLVQQVERLGLKEKIRFFETRGLEEIADVIANADLGVVPKRADTFGNEAYSTKIMELMSLGVPVVASRTAIDSFYFDDTMIRFFESGNSDALADAILDLIDHPELRESLVKNAFEYVARNDWSSKQRGYFELVDGLSAGRCGRGDEQVGTEKLSG